MRKLSLREANVPEKAGGRAETQTSSLWGKVHALQDVILFFLRGCVGEDDSQKTSRRVPQVKMKRWGKDGNSRRVAADRPAGAKIQSFARTWGFRKLTKPLGLAQTGLARWLEHGL